MTLHALYGTLAPEPLQPEWVQTYHITNETGEGRVTIETLFPGMELCFNDMHLALRLPAGIPPADRAEAAG